VVLGAVIAGVIVVVGADDGSATVIVQRAPEPTAEPTAEPTDTPAPTTEPTTSPTETATAEPTEEPTAEPTEDPGPPPLSSPDELVTQYGDPVDATTARLRIPVLGIDAAVGTRFVGGDGQMGLPHGPADMVWYDLSGWTGLGGAPGGGSNAIFSGHVDFNAHVSYAGELGFADRVPYRGRGVLFELRQLSPGDVIEVEVQGETLKYVVSWKERVEATDAPRWDQIWSADVPIDSITLVTCGGDFNFQESSYVDRWVVRAERA
jgi:sortase (surface protein transpeptidase)